MKGVNMNSLMKVLFGLVIAVPVMLAGCYRASHYTGDGQLTDKGAGAATDRYVLNLGMIDLTQQGVRSFRLANLPAENFVVGLEIAAPNDPSVIEKKTVNPVITMELAGPDGKILFARKAPLDTWTWAVRSGEHRAFVYGRDEPKTYFDAAAKTEYTLTLKVIEPDRGQLNYTASLVAKSGGWK
jgi:hypothetical protein